MNTARIRTRLPERLIRTARLNDLAIHVLFKSPFLLSDLSFYMSRFVQIYLFTYISRLIIIYDLFRSPPILMLVPQRHWDINSVSKIDFKQSKIPGPTPNRGRSAEWEIPL